MFKIEQKITALVNKYLIEIALIIVAVAALWIRLAARKYIGYDFHFFLYDIPGNNNSVCYRMLVQWLMERTEEIVILLKLVSYVGDAGVIILACLYLGRQWLLEDKLRLFLAVTALSLSPVVLEYSVAGMRWDSVCMCLLLGSVLALQKRQYLAAVFPVLLAAVMYPSYWIVVLAGVGILVALLIPQGRNAGWQSWAAITVTGLVLIVCIFAEQDTEAATHFFGKIWTMNRFTGESFRKFLDWGREMLMLYGYLIATSLLIYSMKHKKWRIAALAAQVFLTMFVGWQQAGHLSI